jgi:tetratricopeptide (TPR) repeat protein
LRAAFAAAVERSFISALRDGQNSVERHREVLKLDPTFHDAEISIGTYDYVVATLPLPMKILATVGGVRGSRKRGLETLARVAREGKWARDDAKVLLMGLFKREERYADALQLARDLAAKYPRNYLFKLEAADALIAQAAVERQTAPAVAANAEREAFAIFDALLQPERASKARVVTVTPPRPLDLIHFGYGEALRTAGQTERAAQEFLRVGAVAGAEPGLATMGRLRAAQSLDLAGQRKEALVHYTAVLTRPNVYDSHEEAKRGLREPYQKPAPGVAPSQRNNTSNVGVAGRSETRQ